MGTYYEELGVAENASLSEIKSAYRHLARQYHPDVNPDGEEKFKAVSRAYETLSNPDQRAQYDQELHAPPITNPFAGRNPFGGFNPFVNFGGPAVSPNMPVVLQHAFTIEEAMQSHRVTLSYNRTRGCSACGGKGGAGNRTACSTCHGTGQRIHVHQQGGMTIQQMLGPCMDCNQQGFKYEDLCGSCQGSGRITEPQQVHLDVPLGSANRGLVFNGLGNQENMAQPPSQLIVEFVLKPHPLFESGSNHNLAYHLKLDPVRAMLGEEVQVPTPTGEKITLRLPRGCPDGYVEEISGQGLYVDPNNRGILYVKVHLAMPTELTQAQENILRQYIETIPV